MNTKSSTALRVLIGLALAFFLVLAGYGVLRSQDFEPGLPSTGHSTTELIDSFDIEFFFPSDPGFIVIQYHWGRYTGTPALRVFGDGTVKTYRLHDSFRAGPVGEETRELIPAGTHTAQLSFQELQDLIRRLLDTGIEDFDVESIQARLDRAQIEERQRTGDIHMSSAVGVHEITLRFEEIRFAPDSEAVRNYEAKTVWRERNLSLDRAAELYPEITELEGLLDAVNILRNLFEDVAEPSTPSVES
jgi:hypothetical protein